MAPAVEPIRLRIINRIASNLEGINGGSTYWFDFSDARYTHVAKRGSGGNRNRSFPFLELYFADEVKANDQTAPLQMNTFSLFIVATFNEGDADDSVEEVEHLIHDIEVALHADTQLGSTPATQLASDVHVTGSNTLLDDSGQPIGGVVVRVNVLYEHSYTDPAAAA